MKPLRPYVRLLLLPAAIILCLIVIQACVTPATQTGMFRTAFVGSLLELTAPKPVQIPVGEARFIKAIKEFVLPNGFETKYCEDRGGTIVCDEINPKTIDGVLAQLKTKSVTKYRHKESGSGDDMDPDGSHVAQRVSFESKDKLEDFLKAVSTK